MKSPRFNLLPLAFCLAAGILNGQGVRPQSRLVVGPYDTEFTFPVVSGTSGQKDPSAVAIVNAYLTSVGAEPWRGISGEGSLTIGADPTHHHASLAIDSAGRSRLDLDLSSGKRTVKMSDLVGGVAEEHGRIVQYPAAVSAAGLFITPHTLSDALKNVNASLIDRGTVKIGDATFHEISYIRPLNARLAASKSALIPPLATTLLFDPETHFLIKTIDGVRFSDNSGTKILRVISFGDYRTVERAALPHSYQETLDGSLSYRLVLNTAQTECAQGIEYFDLAGGVR